MRLERIAFAATATHNHFAYTRGRVAFNRSAPVLDLKAGNGHPTTMELLYVLNSSVVGFWLRQNSQPKAGGGIGRGLTPFPYEQRRQISCTTVEAIPMPEQFPSAAAVQIEQAVQGMKEACASAVRIEELNQSIMSVQAAKDLVEKRWKEANEQMIALQEELDWRCYALYGLTEEALVCASPPPIRLGERPFEIVLARRLAAGEERTSWFERHGSKPIIELPDEWPEDYRKLVARRIDLIESDRNIRLIEQPECKRRWDRESWDLQLHAAFRERLLSDLESYFDFDGRMNEERKPTARIDVALISVGRLADIARKDAQLLQVGELYREDPAFDVSRLVAELVEAESVPLLPGLRYEASGMRNRGEWKKTWELQRQEDEIDARTQLPKDHKDHLTGLEAKKLKQQQVGSIPVPATYKREDFLKADYWRLRDKLDVPKERWVSFPHCEGEDGTLMVAWAGYDHLQLARAISAYYVDVQERLGGREDPRLVPLLACLIELLPWLKQWHNEVDPEFGVPMGDYFEGFLQEESRNLGLTLAEIKAWQPPQRAARRPRTSGAGSRSTSRQRNEDPDTTSD